MEYRKPFQEGCRHSVRWDRRRSALLPILPKWPHTWCCGSHWHPICSISMSGLWEALWDATEHDLTRMSRPQHSALHFLLNQPCGHDLILSNLRSEGSRNVDKVAPAWSTQNQKSGHWSGWKHLKMGLKTQPLLTCHQGVRWYWGFREWLQVRTWKQVSLPNTDQLSLVWGSSSNLQQWD